MRRLAVVVAVAVAGCSFGLQGIPKDRKLETTFPKTAAATELPEQFKVVAFNIHKEPAAKFIAGMQADRATRDADLILLEEVPRFDGQEGCSAACGAGKLLGYYAIYAPAHHAEERDIGVAILSRAPITSARVIELPWNDVHFNAGRRAALAVTIQQAGRPITVYAVHLENRLSVGDRKKQMTPILEDAKRQPTPVLIAGDFNTNPFHWVSHWLPLPTAGHQATKLESLVRSYGFDTPVKDSGPTHRFIGMKLDAIYTRGFETRNFGTAHAKDVSDHLALWATVNAKRAATKPVAPAANVATVAATK
ncbi:MAG TPA: endonuclease/exonuclease/phosphatase family protein [Kofleriaceae bacterium]|nr:endonuclease/exonuclease/phosphatase family protein [Kofleriaceae bacterium]